MRNTVLFSDITIVTPDMADSVSIMEHAYCVTSGNTIEYVGVSKEKATQVAESFGEYDVYEGKNRILCPTFVNAHAHASMSIFRNIADDLALEPWLFGEIIPREDKMIAKDFRYGHLLSLAEMIEGGTGCAANMYDGARICSEASVEAGFRCQQTALGKKFIDGVWHTDEDEVRDFVDYCKNETNGLILPSLLVHSIYLYTEDFYTPLKELGEKYKTPISVHISETRTENANCVNQYGMSPVEKLDSFGLLTDTTVAAHCVHLSDNDRTILADRGVWVAHNPSSNMKLASGFADMISMQKAGVRLCLGTDGASSNNNQDMYMEMRLASFMAKATSYDSTVLKASEVFRMATRTGYLACGFTDCGIIGKGMKADLQIVDYDCPQMWPLGNPLSALVYSCGPKCVESTMIDGKFVYYKRELTTIDMERVKAETSESMDRLK